MKRRLDLPTERDMELATLLVSGNAKSFSELATRLKISRQFVSKRVRQLEKLGIVSKHYFWNIVPRFELTKKLEFTVGTDELETVVDAIMERWIVPAVFAENIKGGKARIELIALADTVDELTEFVTVIGGRSVRATEVLMKAFLGSRAKTKRKSIDELESLAKRISRRFKGLTGVIGILWWGEENGEELDILVLTRSRRLPSIRSYEEVLEETYVDYHFSNLDIFKKKILADEREWVKELKVAWAVNPRIEKEIANVLSRAITS